MMGKRAGGNVFAAIAKFVRDYQPMSAVLVLIVFSLGWRVVSPQTQLKDVVGAVNSLTTAQQTFARNQLLLQHDIFVLVKRDCMNIAQTDTVHLREMKLQGIDCDRFRIERLDTIP